MHFDAEYKLMITQRLVLITEVELIFFGEDDETTGAGLGLSTSEVGLRLAYQILVCFCPILASVGKINTAIQQILREAKAS